MRFLVDNQLPGALATLLREQGHEAEHVLELGLAQGKDNPIWQRATATSAVIITKDEDFAEWVRRGRPGPAVVWLRVGTRHAGHCSNGSLRCCQPSSASFRKASG